MLVSRGTVHATQAVVLCAHRISVRPTVGEVCWKRPLIDVRHRWWLLGISARGISLVLLLLLVALSTYLEGALLVWRCHKCSLLIRHARVAASPATATPAIAAAARGLIVTLLLLLHPLLRVRGLCLPLLCWGPVHIRSSLPHIHIGGMPDALLGWHQHLGGRLLRLHRVPRGSALHYVRHLLL